jgi:hypothetical protein
MNTGRVIAGSICLACAVLIGVLWLTLPADAFFFNMGGENRPWIPFVILGSVGIALLATAGIGRPRVQAEATETKAVIDPVRAAMNKRLETIGWGCFLVMFGGYALVPHTVVAEGFWSIGVGLIMLGLNAARYLKGIKMSGFTTALGVLSLIGGVLQLMGIEVLEGAFLLIILGAMLLVKPWFDKRQLFGKAEEA